MLEKKEGGCLCGHLRYEITAGIIDAGYCHCRRCQLASGAPVTAWLSTDPGGFAYTHGSPTIHRAQTGALREFCPVCGTTVVFRSDDVADEVDIAVASLDQPEAVPPEYHIWCASRVTWLEISDTLAHYDDAGPDRRG